VGRLDSNQGPPRFVSCFRSRFAQNARALGSPRGRPVPGTTEEGPMTFTYRLELADGSAADPPTFATTAYNWRPGTASR
jgi:hypothetical protein